MAARINKIRHRVHTKSMRRGSITILCPTSERAHALRHELDKMGALSKRKGRRVSTTASMELVAKARQKVKRSARHGRTR
jgi:hypothetical protein